MTRSTRNRLAQIRRRFGTTVSTLIDQAIDAGATIKPTKAGLIFRCPSGSAVAFHTTPSDHRAAANQAAALRRALA